MSEETLLYYARDQMSKRRFIVFILKTTVAVGLILHMHSKVKPHSLFSADLLFVTTSW